jgi:hypothetical protein
MAREEMSANADSDASDAMSRVTGVSVVGGEYVYVRGLGERYSNTTLNGSILPTTEPDKRVVPLDLFPTALLESVKEGGVVMESAPTFMEVAMGAHEAIAVKRALTQLPFGQFQVRVLIHQFAYALFQLLQRHGWTLNQGHVQDADHRFHPLDGGQAIAQLAQIDQGLSFEQSSPGRIGKNQIVVGSVAGPDGVVVAQVFIVFQDQRISRDVDLEGWNEPAEKGGDQEHQEQGRDRIAKYQFVVEL